MKKLFSLLLAVILILPMGACAEGGENMANYLYSGVELPELPEWDKTKYPYAIIRYIEASNGKGDRYLFYALPYVNYKDRYGWEISISNSDLYASCLYYPDEDVTWGNLSETEWNYTPCMVSDIIWTNFDVLNEDGSIYLEASIPILADSKLAVSVAQMMSYNGTELAEVPEWDKETYPYALITRDDFFYGESQYNLRLSTMPLSVLGTSRIVRLGAAEDGSVILDAGGVAPGVWGGELQEESFEAGGEVGTTSALVWANFDVLKDGTLYLKASEPTAIETAVVAFFSCKDLISTDKVYRIKAWCYPKGMDFWTAPVTWESDLFAGPSHSESVTFTGLLSDTEYEVYACIYANGTATEHNAHTTFTTAASEEETLEAVVMCNQVTENSFVAWLLAIGLDSSKEYTAVFEALENDETSAGSKTFTFSRSSVSQSCAFTGLKPNTDYVVYVDLYTEDRLVFSGECEVTTLEGEISYDRDSFLLGFASGLGCTAATKDGAEYNSWAQGYLAGCALRRAL